MPKTAFPISTECSAHSCWGYGCRSLNAQNGLSDFDQKILEESSKHRVPNIGLNAQNGLSDFDAWKETSGNFFGQRSQCPKRPFRFRLDCSSCDAREMERSLNAQNGLSDFDQAGDEIMLSPGQQQKSQCPKRPFRFRRGIAADPPDVDPPEVSMPKTAFPISTELVEALTLLHKRKSQCPKRPFRFRRQRMSPQERSKALKESQCPKRPFRFRRCRPEHSRILVLPRSLNAQNGLSDFDADEDFPGTLHFMHRSLNAQNDLSDFDLKGKRGGCSDPRCMSQCPKRPFRFRHVAGLGRQYPRTRKSQCPKRPFRFRPNSDWTEARRQLATEESLNAQNGLSDFDFEENEIFNPKGYLKESLNAQNGLSDFDTTTTTMQPLQQRVSMPKTAFPIST